MNGKLIISILRSELDILGFHFDTSGFPQKDCGNEETLGSTIFTSDHTHLCLIADERFPKQARLETLRPYICLTETETLFGWLTLNGDRPVNHHKHSIHEDSERVIAYAPAGSSIDFMDISASTKSSKWIN